MSNYSKHTWNQSKNSTLHEIQSAPSKDGWKPIRSKGARVSYRRDKRVVTLHIHPKKTMGPSLLRHLLAQAGWDTADLKRLKLIK